jgi:two-component system, cell cycle response regulator
MPGADALTAQRRVQALLEQWRQQSFAAEPAAPRDESGLHGLSFSAGVADSLRVPGSAERLLQAADQELLGAKRQGRARVLVHAAAVLHAV